MWNYKELRKPSLGTTLYSNDDIHQTGGFDELQKHFTKFYNVYGSKHSTNSADIENRLLSQFLYKVSTVHSREKQFRALKKVQKCLKREAELNLGKLVQPLINDLPSLNSLNTSVFSENSPAMSTEMLDYVLNRCQGVAALQQRTVGYCIEAFSYTLNKLPIGHFLPRQCVIASIVSRIWVLLKYRLSVVIAFYQDIRPFRKKLKYAIRSTEELKPVKLPKSLSKWLRKQDESYLGCVHINSKQRTLQSLMNKRANEEITVNLQADDDFSEQEIGSVKGSAVNNMADLGKTTSTPALAVYNKKRGKNAAYRKRVKDKMAAREERKQQNRFFGISKTELNVPKKQIGRTISEDVASSSSGGFKYIQIPVQMKKKGKHKKKF